jgi:glutathione-regulated potassium-efflux system ancillary protein KefF
MSTAVVIHGHPFPRRSRAGRVLLDAIESLPNVSVRSLYDLYPDFAIDAERERAELVQASVVVWQCPFQWYGVPALVQLWFEKVLEHGFAYGEGGDALCGKPVLWVTTTGTAASAYTAGGMHRHPFAAFVHPVEQTARFCGLDWQEPIVVHDAHGLSRADLDAFAVRYKERVSELLAKAS